MKVNFDGEYAPCSHVGCTNSANPKLGYCFEHKRNILISDKKRCSCGNVKGRNAKQCWSCHSKTRIGNICIKQGCNKREHKRTGYCQHHANTCICGERISVRSNHCSKCCQKNKKRIYKRRQSLNEAHRLILKEITGMITCYKERGFIVGEEYAKRRIEELRETHESYKRRWKKARNLTANKIQRILL